ncbi:MAG TPA: ribosome biogenesis GTP-binding protein YihA/YsxC, partial [Thermodesulfobacteriota bacterium]|nr:ribosome biogenesis GTP-binding protein YihA/YsxC [Thermodesulfobacteriota bacterium]
KTFFRKFSPGKFMRIKSAEFAACAVRRSQYPGDGLPEVVLIGRSNVGKSSLINVLVKRKGLAKTSSEPGKTRTVNFYRVNGEFYLVDLPGFGYARVPRSEKISWEKMVGEYVAGRAALRGALVILDPRRDPGETEELVFDWLERLKIPVVMVLTKADKLSRNKLNSRAAGIKRAFDIEDPVLFSSLTHDGRVTLLKKIQEMLGGNFLEKVSP